MNIRWYGAEFSAIPFHKKTPVVSNRQGFHFYFKLISEINYLSNQADEAVLTSCWQSLNFNFFNLNSYNFFFVSILSNHCNLGNFLFHKPV